MTGCAPLGSRGQCRRPPQVRAPRPRRLGATLAATVAVAMGLMAGQATWAWTSGFRSAARNGASPQTKRQRAEALWSQLRDSPDDWLDFRPLKQRQAVKPRHPDFKHSRTGDSLWLDNYETPAWVHEADLRVPVKAAPASFAGASTGRPQTSSAEVLWSELRLHPEAWLDFRPLKQEGVVKTKWPDFKHAKTGKALWISSASTPAWALSEDLQVPAATREAVGAPSQGAMPAASSSKQEWLEQLWGHLFDEPDEWRDFRSYKERGAVSPNFPDFKRADGKSLWLEGAPAWVSEELQSAEGPSWRSEAAAAEEAWKSLFDNPWEWTDFRDAKKSGEVKPKYPDFKRDSSGEVLWLGRHTPDWAQARLLEAKGSTWKQYEEPTEREERLWVSLFEDPEPWTDYRAAKLRGEVKEQHPDFKHTDTYEVLWLNSRRKPDWVDEELDHADAESASQLRQETQDKNAQEAWRSLGENGESWLDNRALKESGEVAASHPDFQHTSNGAALWVSDPRTPEEMQRRLKTGEPVATASRSEEGQSGGGSSDSLLTMFDELSQD